MPKPMHRSHSFRKLKRVTPKGRNVVHYEKHKTGMPHCAICGAELNGIRTEAKGGKSRRTNSRLFGGVLCADCTAEVVKLGSRVEEGYIKLDDISTKYKNYVLQLVAH
ncbi:MAG: 50S ribosomal protein L34e [Candidatus Micrarchaeia archaeon]